MIILCKHCRYVKMIDNDPYCSHPEHSTYDAYGYMFYPVNRYNNKNNCSKFEYKNILKRIKNRINNK